MSIKFRRIRKVDLTGWPVRVQENSIDGFSGGLRDDESGRHCLCQAGQVFAVHPEQELRDAVFLSFSQHLEITELMNFLVFGQLCVRLKLDLGASVN